MKQKINETRLNRIVRESVKDYIKKAGKAAKKGAKWYKDTFSYDEEKDAENPAYVDWKQCGKSLKNGVKSICGKKSKIKESREYQSTEAIKQELQSSYRGIELAMLDLESYGGLNLEGYGAQQAWKSLQKAVMDFYDLTNEIIDQVSSNANDNIEGEGVTDHASNDDMYYDNEDYDDYEEDFYNEVYDDDFFDDDEDFE